MGYWDHATGPGDRWALRARAVQAVGNGEKKSHVARDFGITRQTLHNWLARHRSGGVEALAARPRGRVRRQVLEPWQEAQVASAIASLPPSTVDERFTSWTRKAVALFIEQQFSVRLSPWLVDSHLRRWGLTARKEVGRAPGDGPSREHAHAVPPAHRLGA